MENITRILWEHDDDTVFAWRMSLLWNICNKIRVEYPDKVTEPFIRIRKILAWLDIRYQTHHGAIGAVLRHRIPEDEPLHQIFIGNNAPALLKPIVSQELILTCPYLRPIYPYRVVSNHHAKHLMERFEIISCR